MDRLHVITFRTLVFVMITVVLAGCAAPAAQSPTPKTVEPDMVIPASPSITASTGPSATTTQVPPSPTPTASPTPIPQPIDFANAGELQIIGEVENFDQSGEVFARALSPDGRLAAIAGCLDEDEDMKCHGTTLFRIFDVASGAVLLDPEFLSPAIEVLAFSPDGRVLAAAGCDISLWIYGELDTLCDLPRAWLIDTETGELIAELTGYTSHVTDFAFSPDGATLFTSVIYLRNIGDGDHVIRAYDARTGEKLATIETGMINCTRMFLDMSPDGRYIIGNVTSPCGTQSFVAWWDVQDPRAPVQVGNVPSFGRSRVSPDSTQILVNNLNDNTLKIYDLETGSPIKLIPNVPRQSALQNFTYLDDRDTILINVASEYDIVDVPSGEIIHRLLPPEGGIFYGYLLTPDHRTMFVVSSHDEVQVEAWDLATWQSTPLVIDPDNAWLWQDYSNFSQVTFLPDETALVGIDLFFGTMRAQTWGFADTGQAQAAQALRDYFDLLVNGDYETAIQMYINEESVRADLGKYVSFYTQYPVSYLETQLTDMDFSDMAGLYAQLCQEPDFPCMPVRDILYQAKVGDGLYRFTITFALPDGSLADWPPCSSVPASHFCWHRGGVFEYFVLQTSDGSYKIVEGLPPAVGLFIE